MFLRLRDHLAGNLREFLAQLHIMKVHVEQITELLIMHKMPPVFDALNPAVLRDDPVVNIVVASCGLYLLLDDAVDLFNVLRVHDICEAPASEAHEVLNRVALKDFCDVITDKDNLLRSVSLIYEESAGKISSKFVDAYAVIVAEHINRFLRVYL